MPTLLPFSKWLQANKRFTKEAEEHSPAVLIHSGYQRSCLNQPGSPVRSHQHYLPQSAYFQHQIPQVHKGSKTSLPHHTNQQSHKAIASHRNKAERQQADASAHGRTGPHPPPGGAGKQQGGTGGDSGEGLPAHRRAGPILQ